MTEIERERARLASEIEMLTLSLRDHRRQIDAMRGEHARTQRLLVDLGLTVLDLNPHGEILSHRGDTRRLFHFEGGIVGQSLGDLTRRFSQMTPLPPWDRVVKANGHRDTVRDIDGRLLSRIVRTDPLQVIFSDVERYNAINVDPIDKPGLLRQRDHLARELEKSGVVNDRLRILFDQSSYSMCITNPDGLVVDVNQYVLQTYSLDRNRVVGKWIWNAPWWRGYMNSHRRLQQFLDLARTGQTSREILEYRGPDGETRYWDFICTPSASNPGDIRFVLTTGLDVTNRITAERELQTSEAFNSAMMQGSPDGIAILDGRGCLRMVNQIGLAQMGSNELSEAVDRQWTATWPPSEADRVTEAFKRAQRDGHARFRAHRQVSSSPDIDPPKRSESERPKLEPPRSPISTSASSESMPSESMPSESLPSESASPVQMDATRWYDVIVRHIPDGAANPDRYIAVSRDVTDQYNAEEQLKNAKHAADAANQAKSQFIANMSHEIRTPMTSILGYVDLMYDVVDNVPYREHLETIRRNGTFLLGLINDILDLSKIEAGRMDIHRTPIDVRRLVDDVVSVMKIRSDEKGLQLRVDIDTRLPPAIITDRRQLKQILINLVGNAIKFTDDGEVRLKVDYDAEQLRPLRFEVIDTGIGMTPEQIERLFVPFMQGDASVSRRYGGTGLGLAISIRLTEALGGTLSVNSQHGEGSCFIVELDVEISDQVIEPSELNRNRAVTADRDDTPSASPSETLPTSDATDEASSRSVFNRREVLIVDDSSDIRFLVGTLLRREGVRTHDAEDGAAALEWLRERLANDDPPDLILLDMQMPRLDGYRAAKAFREIGFQRPVIALTADAMFGDMRRCLESGCNDYLSKPIERQRFLRTVEHFLADDSETAQTESRIT